MKRAIGSLKFANLIKTQKTARLATKSTGWAKVQAQKYMKIYLYIKNNRYNWALWTLDFSFVCKL